MEENKEEEGKMAAEGSSEIVNPYSWQIGFIYVFNLIIGAGVLALPKAFAEVGWLLGLITLCVLAFISFITVSFTTESMSLANALLRYQKSQKKPDLGIGMTDVGATKYRAIEGTDAKNSIVENAHARDEEEKGNGVAEAKTKDSTVHSVTANGDVNEQHAESRKPSVLVRTRINPVITAAEQKPGTFDITVKFELGDMASLFFNRVGVILYYASICIYLYGSAAVYAAIIGKSMTTVLCDDSQCFKLNENGTGKACKRFSNISADNIYRIMLSVFVIVICPFAFFEIKNTKVLQIFTTSYRWFSMFSMIALAFVKVGKGDNNTGTINFFVFSKLPNFFGVALYAFMCQHSIPAVTTPVSNKRRLMQFIAVDFVSIILFYSTLLMSSIFAFAPDAIDDVYTLNFVEPAFFKYLLQLFPVLTLSATFPIFSIVLRENIKNLFLTDREKNYGIFIDRILFSLVSIIPPLVVAFLTHDVGTLVKYTGSYAGAIIQYVVPAALVYCGRRKVRSIYGAYTNKHRSPFARHLWVYFILFWYVLCMVFVTYNTIIEPQANVGPVIPTIATNSTTSSTTISPSTTATPLLYSLPPL